MTTSTLRIDTSGFARELDRFRRNSKKDFPTILKEQARLVVKAIIALTPPGRGKADAAARKRGEAIIAADLARIFSPASQEFIDRFIDFNGGPVAQDTFGHKGAAPLGFVYTRALERGEMSEWHETRRRKDGRVMQVNRNVTTGLKKRDLRGLDVGLVETKAYEWFKKRVQARVGILASGWNKAAKVLGYNPPAWVRRHGDGRGDISMQLDGERLKIIVSNEVKFAASVKGIERRVTRALNQQAAAMKRRTDYFLKRNAKRSGFRVS